jgi:predicted DNA-binding transcriptional regulator AlpA
MAEDRRWDSPLLQPFLRTEEAARIIQVSPRTLEKHRSYGTGPKWSKVGGRVIYAFSDLQEWVGAVGAERSAIDPKGTAVPSAMLSSPEAARFLKMSVRTLERHRVYRTGPKWSKVDRRIFYASGDLQEWAERGAKRATSDPATVLPARPADEIALRSEPDGNPSASDLDVMRPDTIDNNDSQSAPPLTKLRRGV